MKILSLDLGQVKTVACVYSTATTESAFVTVSSTPEALHELFVAQAPDRVVLEIGPTAGWVYDLASSLGLEVQVANPNHEAWRWRNIKHKSDRKDALKLARLSAMNQLPLVYMPNPERRAYRELIRYRQTLVGRATAVKNSIRAILTRQGLKLAAGKNGWSQKLRHELWALAQGEPGGTWRCLLGVELGQLDSLEEAIRGVEKELRDRAAREKDVILLQTIPGVGIRLAETVVAIIDDPHRFRRGREVASYAGLTPRRHQSGSMDRQGRISSEGDRLLRQMLVQVAWIGRRYNPWMQAVYERVRRGSESRKKTAIVALARRILIRCWAMMRDGTPWRPAVSLQLVAA